MPDQSKRRPGRLDRVNHAVQEVIADELEVIADERLGLVTVTGVRVDPDMRHALVWFSSLVRPGSRPDDVVAAILGEHRIRLQKAIARQLRLKRTPELAFRPDPAIVAGSRVEEILRGLQTGPAETGPVETGPVETGPAETGPVETGPVEIGHIQSGSIQTGDDRGD